jgi:hypothetical protein
LAGRANWKSTEQFGISPLVLVSQQFQKSCKIKEYSNQNKTSCNTLFVATSRSQLTIHCARTEDPVVLPTNRWRIILKGTLSEPAENGTKTEEVLSIPGIESG